MRPNLAAERLRDVDDGREDRERDREKPKRVAPVAQEPIYSGLTNSLEE